MKEINKKIKEMYKKEGIELIDYLRTELEEMKKRKLDKKQPEEYRFIAERIIKLSKFVRVPDRRQMIILTRK